MRFSASRRRLLDACQWFARADVEAPPEEPSEPAQTGTALHALIDAHLSKKPEPELPDGADVETARAMFDRWRVWFDAWDYRAMPWRSEVPLAFDLETGEARELPSTGHRDYSAARATEVPGTADAVGWPGDECVYLVDWKSTRTFYDLIDPKPQLRTLALSAARAQQVSSVLAFAVYISIDGVHCEPFMFDAFDLLAEEAALAELLERATSAEPAPGTHCRYCPARAVCPKTAGVVDQAAPDTSRALALVAKGAIVSDAQIARAHEQLQIAEDVIEAAKKRLKELVAERGKVRLDERRVLTIVDGSRTTLSEKSIKEAMPTEASTPILAHLRKAGAFKTSHFKKLQEMKG